MTQEIFLLTEGGDLVSRELGIPWAHDPKSGKLVLTSKAGIFEEDEAAAERIYVSILAPWLFAAE